MKCFRHLSGFLAVAALSGAALESSAQLTLPYTDTFDTATSAAGWNYWFGVIPGSPAVAWDSTKDAANNPASGSLKVSIPWTGTPSGQYWTGQFWSGNWNVTGVSGLPSVEMIGACITNVSCDIHVDPSSPISSARNFGAITFAYNGAVSWSGSTVTLPLSASNGWMHVSVPIPANAVPGVFNSFCMSMNTPSGAPANSTTLFWIDNFKTEATANYTNGFNAAPGEYGSDDGSSANSWVYGQGILAPAIYGQNSAVAWSSSMDANGNSASGSLEVSIPWTGSSGNAAGANLSQAIFGTFADRFAFDNGETISGFNFQNMYCSVHVDPISPKNAAGNYGVLQFGFVQESNSLYGSLWSGFTLPTGSVTLNANASVGWTNIVVPIDYLTPGLESISGIYLEMQTGAAQGGGLPGTTLLYVDNLGMNAAAGPTLPGITSVSALSTNMVIHGINPGGDSTYWYVMLCSTDLSLPIARWTPVASDRCNANGTFSYTNGFDFSQPAMYYTFYITNAGILAPDASFTMSTNLGVAPFTVNFTDTSTKNPTSWFWTFGDGSTSTLQNPSYTFTNIWRQTVTLTASNAYGANACSQIVFQCFPCDAVYDWTAGTEGQIANVATLTDSLVAGGNTIGTFTTTNYDPSSTSLAATFFTNVPAFTNGCPVVFSNRVIDFNYVTNALGISWANSNQENFSFRFNSGLVVTNLVWIFYDTLPFTSNTFTSADEAFIATTLDNPSFGSMWIVRGLGKQGPLLPGTQNLFREVEGNEGYGNSTLLWEVPNRLSRLVWQANANGSTELAVADAATGALWGLITNFNTNDAGHNLVSFGDGHIGTEVFITNETSIMAYHDIISVNRPLSLSQISNVVMFGP